MVNSCILYGIVTPVRLFLLSICSYSDPVKTSAASKDLAKSMVASRPFSKVLPSSEPKRIRHNPYMRFQMAGAGNTGGKREKARGVSCDEVSRTKGPQSEEIEVEEPTGPGNDEEGDFIVTVNENSNNVRESQNNDKVSEEIDELAAESSVKIETHGQWSDSGLMEGNEMDKIIIKQEPEDFGDDSMSGVSEQNQDSSALQMMEGYTWEKAGSSRKRVVSEHCKSKYEIHQFYF